MGTPVVGSSETPSAQPAPPRLPAWMFPPAVRAWSDDAWAVAAAGRVAAVTIYLVGYVVAVLADAGDYSFQTFWQSLFSRYFLVASAATLVSVAAIALHRDAWSSVSARGRQLAEGALLGAVGLAVLCAVGAVIGFIANLPDLGDRFGLTFWELTIDVAAFIAAATAGLWALSELDRRRTPAG